MKMKRIAGLALPLHGAALDAERYEAALAELNQANLKTNPQQRSWANGGVRSPRWPANP